MAGDRELRPQIDDNVIQGLVAFGAPDAVIARARAQLDEGGDVCEVWEDNWHVVMFYLTICTQWMISPSGGYVGLNYLAIEAAMNMQHISKIKRKTLFNDLQVIEYTMLPILNKPKT